MKVPLLRRAVSATAGAALACLALSACSLEQLGADVEYSCTDDGIVRTSELAQEIGDAITADYVVSTDDHAHGCDSTPSGVYDFEADAMPTIVDRFGCRPDRLGFEHDGMLCQAQAGPFALYGLPEDGVVAIEALSWTGQFAGMFS